MNGYADFPPSPSSPTKEPEEPQPNRAALQEDVDMSSGSSGNETSGNRSTGQGSQSSDCEDSGKELGMLVEPLNTHQR
jgi:period circadian protein